MQRHDVASTLMRHFYKRHVPAGEYDVLIPFKPDFYYMYLADTCRLNNVDSTSMQRHDVASTLRRRFVNVMCPLIAGLAQNTRHFRCLLVL